MIHLTFNGNFSHSLTMHYLCLLDHCHEKLVDESAMAKHIKSLIKVCTFLLGLKCSNFLMILHVSVSGNLSMFVPASGFVHSLYDHKYLFLP